MMYGYSKWLIGLIGVFVVSSFVCCSYFTEAPLNVAPPQVPQAQAVSTGQVQFYFPRAGEDVELQLVGIMLSATSTLDIAIWRG